MGKIIAVANQKGGVGKTTSAVNIAAGLAVMGKKVLLFDLDPQGNASSGLGVEPAGKKSSYDVMMGETAAKEAVFDTKWCDVVPSDNNLAGAEIELVSKEGRESILKKALEPLKERYDYIFIDCPPSLSILTINALVCCDTVLVPMQCEYYALEGLSQLVQTIRTVKKSMNPNIYFPKPVLGLFLLGFFRLFLVHAPCHVLALPYRKGLGDYYLQKLLPVLFVLDRQQSLAVTRRYLPFFKRSQGVFGKLQKPYGVCHGRTGF